MVRIDTAAELREVLASARAAGQSIGFVPTMGALHDGHISLIRTARLSCDLVVMSIFVNPRQFGPAEDFTRYPRPIEEDEQRARDGGVDVLFTPTVQQMYPSESRVTVSAGHAAGKWEGEVRPGHFDGMLTVVAKLFNIVRPDIAVFGQKDLQQVAMVRAMVTDLDFALEIVVAPTVREPDGLAMSSRNRYLSPRERSTALVLSRAVTSVAARYARGARDPDDLLSAGRAELSREPAVTIDYFAIVDADTFEIPPATQTLPRTGRWAAIIAARVGVTRLIDNALLQAADGD